MKLALKATEDLTSAHLRERSAQARAVAAIQVASFSARRCYEGAADRYEEAAEKPPGPDRLHLVLEAESLESEGARAASRAARFAR